MEVRSKSLVFLPSVLVSLSFIHLLNLKGPSLQRSRSMRGTSKWFWIQGGSLKDAGGNSASCAQDPLASAVLPWPVAASKRLVTSRMGNHIGRRGERERGEKEAEGR